MEQMELFEPILLPRKLEPGLSLTSHDLPRELESVEENQRLHSILKERVIYISANMIFSS